MGSDGSCTSGSWSAPRRTPHNDRRILPRLPCDTTRWRAAPDDDWAASDCRTAPGRRPHQLIPTLGVQSSSDQRAALPARPCHPSGWSGACGDVPIHVSARALTRPQQSPASAGVVPQRLLLLRSPSGSGAGVRARRRWPRRRHPDPPTVRRAIGAAPATALRSAPAASCALRQR